jgi:2-polyprenyl-3-methyl-5-hydroxy-6-metoxy-1,4-benzoquinol methylase
MWHQGRDANSTGGAVKTLEELNSAAANYYFTSQQTGIDNRCRERMIARCLRAVPKGHVLELGFMDGQWTDRFLDKGCRITVVEGAARNLEYGSRKYLDRSDVTLIHSTFETFEPADRYDCILMGGMLKHVDDPVALLRRSKSWLKAGGLLIATTPNARSLHRRIGVHMGLLKDLNDLSPTDRSVGNRRHYDLGSFRNLLANGGYFVEQIGTAVIKPVSSELMQDWSDQLLDALDRVADEIPDFGWYIYALCR